jgi:hypothetical protein
MDLFRTYRQPLLFCGVLALSSVLVITQFWQNDAQHVELRESFVLLYSRGYEAEAERLFQKLLAELKRLPDKQLTEDFQRTLTLVNPRQAEPDNLLWKYHWTVSNELEKRAAGSLQKALKLAEEK